MAISLAVTIGLTVNILSKLPGSADILGACQLFMMSWRLVVGEVPLYTNGTAEPSVQITATYSLLTGCVAI